MERLTERFENGQVGTLGCGNNCKYNYRYCDNALENCPTIAKIFEKLADYEDAEEQGLLLWLPCKVGDKLYYIDSYYNVVVPVRLNEVIIQFVGINNYTYQYNCCSFDECGDTYEEYEFNNNDFGKTVFLTREEAEAKLKEMESSAVEPGKE